MQLVSIGEILWDLIGGAEFLGGAPYNFCVHAARLGHQPAFVSAVGDDERGRRARSLIAEHGVDAAFVSTVTEAPTGVSEIVLDAAGQATHRLPRPAAYDLLSLAPEQLTALCQARPDWIYFGTLLQTGDRARALLRQIIAACPDAKRFYDVNLRPNSFTPALVMELLQLAQVAKLNDEEARLLAAELAFSRSGLDELAAEFASRFQLEAVCITLGARGCLILDARSGELVTAAGFAVDVADTVGAGDAFSAALLHGRGQHWPLKVVAEFANRVGALVASRSGATPYWTVEEALHLSRGEAA